MSPRKSQSRRGARNANTSLSRAYARYMATNRNLVAPMMRQGTMSITAVCTAFVTVGASTSGSGPSGTTIPEHPGRALTQFNGLGFTSNTEFAQYAATYDEYRVEAIVVEYVPFSTAPTGANELVFLSDYDNELSAGVLTTTQPAVRYSTAKLCPPTMEVQYVYKPPPRRSFPEWATTAATGASSARGSLYIYAKATTNSAYLGSAVVKFIVRFRNSNG